MTGVRPFYDLTNPIIWYRDEAKVSSADDDPGSLTQPSLSVTTSAAAKRRQRSGSIEAAHAAVRKQEQRANFEAYATQLLLSSYQAEDAAGKGRGRTLAAIQASPDPSGRQSGATDLSPSLPSSASFVHDDGGPAHRPELMQRSSSNVTTLMRSGVPGDGTDETSCKSAVEIVSRNAQKGECTCFPDIAGGRPGFIDVGDGHHAMPCAISHIQFAVSYDINKDGYRIAVLTLVKSAYRLGDTVSAMVSLNAGEARVYRVRTNPAGRWLALRSAAASLIEH